MTFLDRLKAEHPELILTAFGEPHLQGCPIHYGYETTCHCPRRENGEVMSCRECWNRKIKSGKYFVTHEVEEKREDALIKVVYCRDCKYYQDNNGGYPHENCKWKENETPNPTDYCSAGEKKDT